MSVKGNKREDIINAAIKIFSQNGFHKAKMEDIAKEAGIGKGTIYEYFDSKKGLFQEMISYGMAQYEKELKRLFSKETNCIDKLKVFANYHGRFLANHIDIAQIVMTQSQVLSVGMKQALMETKIGIFNIIKDTIEQGIEKGELREDIDIEMAVLTIIGAINQYNAKKLYFDKISVQKIDSGKIIDMIYNGLAK